MSIFKGNFKFLIILILIFFGGGIMSIVDNFNYNSNKTGIIYQENDNIVLSEVNKTYNHNINYNLEESYLTYFPVKKTGILDNYNNQGKNLAIPDLTGKQYLGNGIYRLISEIGLTIDYNIYTGVYNINGISTSIYWFVLMNFTLINGDYTFTVELLNKNFTNSAVLYIEAPDLAYLNFNEYSNLKQFSNFNKTTQDKIMFYTNTGFEFNDFKFKIQLEKGINSTSYEVPYIPAMKIDFKGTNQVEYINPFEEQIIKINDIKNVTSIDFDLLNTKYNAVFVWNIKTIENMPFVRFYNYETKLLYDFTDIDEINSIGDTLMAQRGVFSEVMKGVFELIDTFYEGFQRLFTKKNIKFLFDGLKRLWPVVPNYPWL